MDIDSDRATNLTIIVPQIHLGDNYEFPTIPELQMVTLNNPDAAITVTYMRLQPFSTYENLLRALRFRNTEEEPIPGVRIVQFQLLTMSSEGQFATSNIAQSSIQVLARNDRPPVFSQTVYYGSVSENQLAGASTGVIVNATDPDVHSQTSITFSIVDASNDFTIHPQTGVILTARPLDADQGPAVVNLTVRAKDSDGITVQSSTAVVSITIQDLNDIAPVFNQTSYTSSVPESAPSGYVVLTASATDLDRSETNSRVTYTLQEGTNLLTPNAGSGIASGDIITSLPFQIGHTSGIVHLTDPLDHEQTRQYAFFIVATDSGTPPLSSSAAVTVSVEDGNDNRPVFIGTPYAASVSEQAAIGTYILTVQATDSDAGLNGMVVYYLEGTNFFTINETSGVISLSASLDFETQTSHLFRVVARDQANPPLTSTALVNITVLNENDTPPRFLQNNYTISVLENTHFDHQVQATDADSDTITYLIVSQCANITTIDSSTGRLVSTRPLDRETISNCLIIVSAFDGVHTADVDVLITVEDQNDNRPLFNQTIYSASIPELLPVGSTVLTVQASDPDEGSNAAITFSLQPSSTFAINGLTGAITVAAPLNFEVVSSYNLTVVATDGGALPLSSSIAVSITITDSNDVAPLLHIDSLVITYQEESGPVPIAPSIRVIDPDSSPLTMAIVTFSEQACLSDDDVNMVCAGNLTCVELCGEAVMVNETTLGPVAVQYIGKDLQLSINLTGNASTTVYQQILSSLTYINMLPEPVPGVRTVSIIVQDGSNYSNTLQLNISVVLVDDHCPVLETQTSSIMFTENSEPLQLGEEAGLSISDADLPPHQVLSSLLIQLTGATDGSSETISLNSTQPPSLSISTTTNTISISGSATVPVYQQLLRSLVYTNNKDEPTPGLRTIMITPSQPGLNCTPIQFNITVELVNDNVPQLLLQNTSFLAYEEESGPLLFAELAGLRITDADNGNLLAANLTLMGVQDGSSEALQLSSDNLPPGVSMNQTSTSISLTGAASISQYQTLLRSVSYINTAAEPSPGNRTVVIMVYDGQHNTASAVIVIVVLRNDNPLQLSSDVLRFSFTEGNLTVDIGMEGNLVLSDDDENSMVQNLSISLTGREPGREFIGVQVGGSLTNSSTALIFNQPSPVEFYQVSPVHCVRILGNT